VRDPNQASVAQSRAVTSHHMDISCRHFTSGAWCSLAY
jgi:hypothetical protein